MEYLTVTELKDNLKHKLEEVKSGRSFIITKNGKPVACIEPFMKNEHPSWKKAVKPIKLRTTKSSTDYLMEERYGNENIH